MKSYINKLADYREMPFEKEAVIRCPKDYIDAQMKHLTRRYKKNEPVKILKKGDVAVLSLESKLEKFNRSSIFITVGGGIFHKEFEEQLVGHTVGEAFDLTVDGETVRVTVKQATQTVFPEPTDEMAADYAKEHDEFAECTTVEKYREQIIRTYCEEQKREAFYQRMEQILDYVLTHSDWEFDEEELQAWMAEAKTSVSKELEEEGKTLETMSTEELQNTFGIDSPDEIDDLLQVEAERQIATVLWCAAMNSLDAKNLSLEELEEKQEWEFLEKYIKENLIIKEER